jgi:CheY-like chemotaxis protein
MSHGETVSIVLVEDDDGHATLVERNLRRAGITNGFRRFRDGQDVLDYFFGPAASPSPSAGAGAFTIDVGHAGEASPHADPLVDPDLAPQAPKTFPSREDLANFVVLLDLKMPRVDGFEVLRRLKESPQTAAVPVIILTTTDDPREIARCYELGCNVYITKPVEYDAFIEAVRRLGFFLQVVKLPPGHRFVMP